MKRPDMISKAWQKKVCLEREDKVGNQCQINNVVDVIGPLTPHSTTALVIKNLIYATHSMPQQSITAAVISS